MKIRRRRLTDSWLWARIHRGWKQVEKHKERLLLSYKNPDLFPWLSKLYKIFSKMTEFMGVGGFFYQFCLFICCTEDHTCTIVNNGTCVLGAHTVNWCQRSLFEFSSSQLAYYLWTGVASSSYRRTCHSKVASYFRWNVPIVREVHVLRKTRAYLSKIVTPSRSVVKRSRRCPLRIKLGPSYP